VLLCRQETTQSLTARVVKKISTKDDDVLGVTSYGDALYVLLSRPSNQVAVYSVDDHRHQLRRLHLRAFTTHYFNDLASCVRRRCLYVSDHHSRCVHRYDLAVTGMWTWVMSATSRWSVPGAPCGLSVTPVGGNLLVTCQRPDKLVELSADSGQCVREIALQSDIVQPWHGVQLTTGQYVVCHGRWNDLLRVCTVDGDGGVAGGYGGRSGSDVGQMNYPSHAIVDKDSRFIFVADCYNDRVVVLNRSLEFVSYISEGLSRPDRLHFDDGTRRLYVGQLTSGVVVIQL